MVTLLVLSLNSDQLDTLRQPINICYIYYDRRKHFLLTSSKGDEDLTIHIYIDNPPTHYTQFSYQLNSPYLT